MAYQHIKVPSSGEKIRVRKDFSLEVPERPIIPYIEGDGTGIDITPVMLKVVDAAVQKSYGGKKKIVWMEMFAGEKSCRVYGENVWLPEETLQAAKEYVVSIKGPLTTPVGGGIRSINVPDEGNEGQEDPLPGELGDRHQADLDRGLGAPDPPRLPIRHR